MKSVVIFNPNTCHLRREILSRLVVKHRKETDTSQRLLAEHPKIGIEEFQNRFNKLERRHKKFIRKIKLHEYEKARYQ